jgi:putative oxidoreductase
MSIFQPAGAPWTSRMLSVLRVVAGLIFFSTGTMKLFGFPPPPSSMPPCFLYLTFAGAGEWSADALIARARGGRSL